MQYFWKKNGPQQRDVTGWFEIVIHDVWCVEDDNTGFLSVVLEDLGRLYL